MKEVFINGKLRPHKYKSVLIQTFFHSTFTPGSSKVCFEQNKTSTPKVMSSAERIRKV